MPLYDRQLVRQTLDAKRDALDISNHQDRSATSTCTSAMGRPLPLQDACRMNVNTGKLSRPSPSLALYRGEVARHTDRLPCCMYPIRKIVNILEARTMH